MKPKTMVVVKQDSHRGSVVVSTASQRDATPELVRCKRKNGCQPFAPQPASVARRNARERNRVKQVNNGFATLRSHIPPAIAAALTAEKPASRGSSAAAKKLSKVETLKMAVEYIRSLQQLLDDQSVSLDVHKYEPEDSYYSSSPETLASSGEITYYSRSPDSFPKSEGEVEYYTPTNRNFNTEMHDALTSEFYHARSPVKNSTYIDNEDIPLQQHSFITPKSHHQPSSLSPPISDPCPSPTPSYSSDHSSLHAGSIVSTGSGQLTSRMSRLTTMTQPQHIPVVAVQHRSSPDYDSYEAMSPEDEELLDVISMWQQSN